MAKHGEHLCRRWWKEGFECPFKAMPDHEDDEKEKVTDEDTAELAHIRQVSMKEGVRVGVPTKVDARQKPAEEAVEEPVRAVSGSKTVSAIALSVLVATAAHLASGRQGPGRGTFRAAEIMAAKTAGRFAKPTGGRGGGGGFFFEVEKFKGALRRRTSDPESLGPGPFTGGYQGV